MCLYIHIQRRIFMLNIKLLNRLICLESIIDTMFKDDAPDVVDALKVLISVIFGDMFDDHANTIEQQYFSNKEVENKISELEKTLKKRQKSLQKELQSKIEIDVENQMNQDETIEEYQAFQDRLHQQLDHLNHIKQIQGLYNQLKGKKDVK
jgi:hypothetical protein